MKFQIILADLVIEINSIYKKIFFFCQKYIIFEEKVHKADIVVTVTNNDLENEKLIYRNVYGYYNDDIEKSELSLEDLEIISIYRKISIEMLSFNIFLMHGAVVSTRGNGYMFSASSGVGKTTRTRLWMQNIPDSIIVNGDKPLLKVTDDSLYAFGTPWCGKEGWNTNVRVRLKAIFLVERAQDDRDSIVREISFTDAFLNLLMLTYRPTNQIQMSKTLQLLKAIEGKVRFYQFRSKPTADAIRMAYEAVSQ